MAIKPDLTPQERTIENYLLKERWSLTKLGFEKFRIKIRNQVFLWITNSMASFKILNFAGQFNPLNLTSKTNPSEVAPQLESASSQPTSSQPSLSNGHTIKQ